LATVGEMDLSAFYGAYRGDGHGRAAHDPGMMLSLLLYAYCKGQRSSRVIERECVEDVAYRVIAANQRPDHCTIARFRQRHESALAELFGQVLGVCAEAGLVKVGVIAIDGTKMRANASQHAARDYEQLAREILGEAARVDLEEDEQFGEARGDELPPEFQTEHGRKGWLREAKQRLDAKRAEDAKPIPRSRPERLRQAKRRLEEELATECRANAAYEAYRARGVMRDGRRFGGGNKPYEPPETPPGKVNVTDLDSRNVKTPRGYMQGYNAQAAANEKQIVIAAEVTIASSDFGHLQPMVNATQTELQAAGVSDTNRGCRCGRWLLASEANGGRDQSRDPGPGPARCRQATRHSTWLGRRRLRPHATRAGDRPWRRALPQAKGNDRAGVREHEVQPADRPLPTPRQIRRTLRVATDHRHPQPIEAPQAPNSRHSDLKEPSTDSSATTTPSRKNNPTRYSTITSGINPHGPLLHPFTQQPRRRPALRGRACAAPPYTCEGREAEVSTRRFDPHRVPQRNESRCRDDTMGECRFIRIVVAVAIRCRLVSAVPQAGAHPRT